MRPYQNHRLEEWPDVADIQFEARASHVGKFREKCGVFKPYTRKARKRRAQRRFLKRQDRQRTRKLLDRDD